MASCIGKNPRYLRVKHVQLADMQNSFSKQHRACVQMNDTISEYSSVLVK